MLDIDGTHVTRNCPGASRRDFLRVGALALGGLTFGDMLRLKASGQVGAEPAKAKSVIQLWMAGGPSHLDTFDPKPGAGEAYVGPLQNPIGANVAGVQISQLLPKLAKQADKYTILRGMTHPSNGHETATYIVQTGTLPGEMVYPAIGAVVSLKKGYDAGYKGALPPYIDLTSQIGRFSECGFLGNAYAPFATGGDPHAPEFIVRGLSPVPGVGNERFASRQTLLQAVDGFARDMEKDPTFQTMDEYERKAYGLILGDARKAFDLSQEKDELRDRYGRNRFGQTCLAARRLVEHGVPFITCNMSGWDTHHNNFKEMETLCPQLDGGFATLLEDLAQRGLLESTLVVWYGEFGRTPKIANEAPWNGGRHHFNSAFSCVVAGGGFRAVGALGASDPHGETVRDRPVYPWDLSASIYKLLGIDPHGRLPHPQGCVAYVTPPVKGKMKSGGMLTEIM